MSSVKKATVTAMCIALCCVLPLAFHALGLGAAFSPMHIPVLLCGLLCGWRYGIFCGIAGPLLSCFISGMPASAQLTYMVPELATYGLISGLVFHFLYTGRFTLDLFLSLIAAMLLGRVAGGAARMIYCSFTGQAYSLPLWATAYFAASLPGIILHLIIVPAVYLLLVRARAVPGRLPIHRSKENNHES